MAWLFSLSAECGATKSAADQFKAHFDALPLNMREGGRLSATANIFSDSDQNWWCRVTAHGISQSGANSAAEAYQMTELGLLFYERLQSAPSFRYALVGVEVDEFRTYRELIDDELIRADPSQFPGLVLSAAVWEQLGSPEMFSVFAPGYVWLPYHGETYSPLQSAPELRQKFDNLLR